MIEERQTPEQSEQAQRPTARTADGQKESLLMRIINSHLIRSIYRTPWPVDRRSRIMTVLNSLVLHLHPTRIPRHAVKVSYTWCMGGLSFYLMLLLTITGILLMFYYRPSPEHAYWDVKYLMNDVPFGRILRNMHRWAAHAMLITVWLHMLRVFLTGSYKPPREFNWVIGVNLLVLTMLLSFTGYLLPWDQLAMWAVTVGTNMARATPFLGHEGPFGPQLGMTPYNDVRFALLGGSIVGENALIRFYVWHCLGFPFIHACLMAIHFWRVRKDGGISGPL
jgi:quinol-cytochrome oxidoreductase complex cytochrome b subunit